jgi:hypothetical protein
MPRQLAELPTKPVEWLEFRVSFRSMRYLVKARVKAGEAGTLRQAIADGTLGRGSVAGDEYLHDLQQARVDEQGVAQWVEVCFCDTPLAEERPYWERYLELLSVRDAHARRNCRDINGTEPWACCNCDCTRRLEPMPNKKKKLEADRSSIYCRV